MRFKDVVAVAPIDLELFPGTHLLLYGPSAGGKTTLLKALAGLLKPTAGAVAWNDRPLDTFSLDERRKAQSAVGFVFQTDALFDSMNVLENVKLPLLRRGKSQAEATQLATEALSRVGLEHASSKRPENLSGGMKKRTGIARAIVARPDILIADDPFAGLDPKTEAQIAQLLLEVAEGKTLIAALPDPVASLPISRQLRLDRGVETAARVRA